MSESTAKYAIKETANGGWISSSKHIYVDGFELAAFFNSEENAAKAIKEMNRSLGNRHGWHWFNQHPVDSQETLDQYSALWKKGGCTDEQIQGFLSQYIILKPPVFKVIACTVTPNE